MIWTDYSIIYSLCLYLTIALYYRQMNQTCKNKKNLKYQKAAEIIIKNQVDALSWLFTLNSSGFRLKYIKNSYCCNDIKYLKMLGLYLYTLIIGHKSCYM